MDIQTPLSVQSSTQSTPARKSRFHFHSDTKAPVELKELEHQSHKRATDFRRRVNQLDRNVATWTSRFAEEVVQRENVSVEIYDDFVTVPLERSVERFMRLMDAKFSSIQGNAMESTSSSLVEGVTEVNDGTKNVSREHNGDQSSQNESISEEVTATATNALTDDQNDPPSLQLISRQVSILSNKMMRYSHVELPVLRDQHLDSFHRKIKSDVPSRLHMEKTKAAKREQAIFHKFESMAGLCTRSLVEENASRIVSLKMLENKILEAGGWDEKRTCRFLDEVKDIRETLKKESDERSKSDEKVLENILACRVMLQKTLLETTEE